MNLENSGLRLLRPEDAADKFARVEVSEMFRNGHERPSEQEVEEMVASRKRAYLTAIEQAYVGKAEL